ncbi:PilN domain-containing protein [Candidatus Roizmanbacteria bacterium]|nr:MAG: PilN domain-containing protein [Candidatus Roizmanbacteria bacterium]
MCCKLYLVSIPEAVNLTTLNIDDNTYSLRGTSSDSRQLQLFYARLQTDRRFKSVILSNIKRVEQGYLFDLVLNSYQKIVI